MTNICSTCIIDDVENKCSHKTVLKNRWRGTRWIQRESIEKAEEVIIPVTTGQAAEEKALRWVRYYQLFVGIFSLFMILGLSAFYGSGLVSAHDNVKDDPVRCKYYKSIQIHSGDTLWNIAEEYITEDYESFNAYITEVKKINKLSSDQIQDSQYLTVPYYDYR